MVSIASLCCSAIGASGATAGVKSTSPLASERLLLELVKALRTQKFAKEAAAASTLLLAKLDACVSGGNGKENVGGSGGGKSKKKAAATSATTTTTLTDPLLTLRVVGDATITQLKISLALMAGCGAVGLGAAARMVTHCVIPLAGKVDAGNPVGQKVLATLLSALGAAATAAEKPTATATTIQSKVTGAIAALRLREAALKLSSSASLISASSPARAARAIDAALKHYIKACGRDGQFLLSSFSLSLFFSSFFSLPLFLEPSSPPKR